MGGNVLTELWLQQADLFAFPPTVVPVPIATWTPICTPDPQRMTLTILPSDFGASLRVSPVPYGSLSFASAGNVTMPIQLHASLYPLLISGEWWILSNAAIDITIIEVKRRN